MSFRQLSELSPEQRYYMSPLDIKVDSTRRVWVNYFQKVYPEPNMMRTVGVELTRDKGQDGCIVQLDTDMTYKPEDEDFSEGGDKLYLPVVEIDGQTTALLPNELVESDGDNMTIGTMEVLDYGYIPVTAVFKEQLSSEIWIDRNQTIFTDGTDLYPIFIQKTYSGYKVVIPPHIKIYPSYYFDKTNLLKANEIAGSIAYGEDDESELYGTPDEYESSDVGPPRMYDMWNGDSGYVDPTDSFVDERLKLFVKSDAVVKEKKHRSHTLLVSRDSLGYHAELDPNYIYSIMDNSELPSNVIMMNIINGQTDIVPIGNTTFESSDEDETQYKKSVGPLQNGENMLQEMFADDEQSSDWEEVDVSGVVFGVNDDGKEEDSLAGDTVWPQRKQTPQNWAGVGSEMDEYPPLPQPKVSRTMGPLPKPPPLVVPRRHEEEKEGPTIRYLGPPAGLPRPPPPPSSINLGTNRTQITPEVLKSNPIYQNKQKEEPLVPVKEEDKPLKSRIEILPSVEKFSRRRQIVLC